MATSKKTPKIEIVENNLKAINGSLYTNEFYSECFSESQRKAQRTKQRKFLSKFYDKIFLTSDKKGLKSSKELETFKNSDDAKNLFKEFSANYKRNYKVNNFEVSSIYALSESERGLDKKAELQKVLNFFKNFISEKPKKEKVLKTPKIEASEISE